MGRGFDNRDAVIEGTAHLTYSLVSNATYDVDNCLNNCDQVDPIYSSLMPRRWINIVVYYEFNSELPDFKFIFSERSHLKYADTPSTEKTNFGGQQSKPHPAPLTFIQQSSGYFAMMASLTLPVMSSSSVSN